MNLNKDNETTSYLIRKIPKKVWNKFKGYALIKGHNSVGELLRNIIFDWSNRYESERKSRD